MVAAQHPEDIGSEYFMPPRTAFLLLGFIVIALICWAVIRCLQLFQA